jgi:hypothetical protein
MALILNSVRREPAGERPVHPLGSAAVGTAVIHLETPTTCCYLPTSSAALGRAIGEEPEAGSSWAHQVHASALRFEGDRRVLA